jgi:hypothetical protein
MNKILEAIIYHLDFAGLEIRYMTCHGTFLSFHHGKIGKIYLPYIFPLDYERTVGGLSKFDSEQLNK